MATAENMAHFNFMPDVSKIIVVNVKYFDGSEMIYIPHNIYIAGGHIVKLEMYDSEAFSKRVGSSPMETEVFSSLDSSTLMFAFSAWKSCSNCVRTVSLVPWIWLPFRWPCSEPCARLPAKTGFQTYAAAVLEHLLGHRIGL